VWRLPNSISPGSVEPFNRELRPQTSRWKRPVIRYWPLEVQELVATVAYLHARRAADAEPSTAMLVAEARRGQTSACRKLYDRYRSAVNQTAGRLALTAADADDLVQEAFATAFDQIDRLRDPTAFGAWVRAMVVRSAAKRLRRHRLARHLGFVSFSTPTADSSSTNLVSPELETFATLAQVQRALADLPRDAGVALVLHRVEGLTIREIAEQMGISEPTVKRRIKQASQALEEEPCPTS